ncbi:MAG: pseudouridine-5'-phosphate glycosidase [Bacteroidota bacterium]
MAKDQSIKPFLSLSEDVASAKSNKQPIVALESTIISHGMPYPKNVETALKVEATVRENGAIPATIALMNGQIKVGLSHAEIEELGVAGWSATKVSRRDIPFVLQQKKYGATTVAATMVVANWADIRIFATGGVGGVHRNAAASMDISADLQELANTNVAVVSAGAKSILDLPLTLEYLETFGVPVIGYQTEEFPAFYTRESGLKVDYRMDSAKEIAAVLSQKWKLGLKGGVLIANSVPEAHACSKEYIDKIIEQALQEADVQAIKGKQVTPFLLSRIEQLTKGESLVSNIELVLNNARLAASIAREMEF